MSTPKVQAPIIDAQRSVRLTAAVHAALALAAILPAAVFAAAAAPSGDELQEVVVTGIRAAIDMSIQVKQQSDDIEEVVSSEDIGKLPDTNIAQALARLPGVTVQRSGANDSQISIRGFGADFNGTLLNGRNQASTGDSRAIEFDQYPAELISGAVVYKTNNPGVLDQGIAGTIDMHTIRPLEYGRRALAFDVRGVENSNGNLGGGYSDRQYRASAAYVGQFLDNTLGVTLGFSRVDLPIQNAFSATYTPYVPNGAPGACGPPSYYYPCEIGVAPGVLVPNGNATTTTVGVDKRDGVVATIEWKPSDVFASTFDFYYTERKLDQHSGYLSANWTAPGQFTSATVVNNVLNGGTVVGITPIDGITLDIARDHVLSAGWNNKVKVSDWTLAADLGYSNALRDNSRLLTYGSYQRSNPRYGDTETFTLPPGGAPSFMWGNSYNDPSQVLVGRTPYGGGYADYLHITDEIKSVRFDASHSLQGWFKEFVSGVDFEDRAKVKHEPQAVLQALSASAVQLPENYLEPSLNNGYANSPPILNWNVPAVLAQYYKPFVPSSTAYNYLVGNSWEVDEKVTTLYGRGDINHELSDSVKLRGNVGVQVIHAQQGSTALYWNGALNGGVGGPFPITRGTSYTDVTPALNLVFEFPNRRNIRFSLAREIMRPRLDQMNTAFSYGIDPATGQPGASGGSPFLAPWRSNSVDLSLEKYFDNEAYVSLSMFYKKLLTYIYQYGVKYDFALENSEIPPNYLGPGITPQRYGTFTTYYNGAGGRADGLEFALSMPGQLLSERLNGFGVQASIAETDSSISIPGNVGGLAESAVPLPGLSKTVWQAIIYYEKHGFSARFATRYRSTYVGEIYGGFVARQLENVRHEQTSDFQTGYDFSEGRLKGLSLEFQINNIRNAPYIDFTGNPNQIGNYQTYGRIYFLGAKYKL